MARDINPAPLHPGAYYEMAGNIGPSFAAGQQQGMHNALLMDEVARDVATRNALADYLQSPEEQRGAAMNALVAQSPEIAAQVLGVEAAQNELAMMQRRDQAAQEYARAQHVLTSESPALALRLLDEDGAFTQQLIDAELIDPEDGIDDDEARLIAQWVMDTVAPVAGIGEDRAAPAAIREMQALGFPLTPEGFAEYHAARADRTGDPMAAILAQLQIDERQARLERERREAEQAEQAEQEQRETDRRSINRALNQIQDIANLTASLEGTALEVGLPAASFRRAGLATLAAAGTLFGVDTSDWREQVASYDRLVKNFSDQLLSLMQSMDLGRVTNAILEQYQAALANPETSAAAIMRIQAHLAEILLDQADVRGLEVEGRDAIEAGIQRMREFADPQSAVRRDISQMAMEDLQALDPAALSLEELEAAANRWDELSSGR